MTQKELLENVLSELVHIKKHMPNGELKQMQKDMENLKEDISDLKYTLLNPENGVIVNTNKNTEYRIELQAGAKEFQEKLIELEEIKRWKSGVTKALWVVFGVLLAIIGKLLTEGIQP